MWFSDASVHDITPDGAWTWFNDARALIIGHDRLLVGHVTCAGHIAATLYDHRSGRRQVTLLSHPADAEIDDHNNPAFLALPDGRILAAYARHGTDRLMRWRYGTLSPDEGGIDWSEERSLTVPADQCYSNLFNHAGNVVNISRCINWNPTLFVSGDMGQSWSTPQALIKTGTGGTRPYARFASNGQDRIDILYTDGHPRETENSVYHAFFQGGRLYGTGGNPLSELPLKHDLGERGLKVLDGSAHPKGRLWILDVTSPKHNGQGLACIYQLRKSAVAGKDWQGDRLWYFHARWDGRTWRSRLIAQAGRPLYWKERDYAGGAALDPLDPLRLVISSNAADPFDFANMDLAENNRYRLFDLRLTPEGDVSEWRKISRPADALRPKLLPGRQGPASSALCWMEGKYESYKAFQTRIMGCFS